MLNRILDFIEGPYVYCPRCLNRLPLRSSMKQDVPCEECHYVIPLTYIRECRNAPPVFVQLFGLTEAGKTTFLDMLRLHLYDMDRAWQASNFYTRPITQLDLDHQRILLTDRVQGVMPESTARRGRDQNEVYIMSLMHMPRWGSRFLVLMDHAGEQFYQLNINVKEIPFLQHTPVTVMLLSLSDLIDDGERVSDLVARYISSLEACGVNFKKARRHLIIVFSKADLLINDLPLELNTYLNSDTTYVALRDQQQRVEITEANIDNYLGQMQAISDATRAWVEEKLPGGPSMLHMLDDKSITTRFTVISATGHPLIGGNQLTPEPRRVLDPFFWVLEYYKRLGTQNIVQASLATIAATFSPSLRGGGVLILLFAWFVAMLCGGIEAFSFSGGSSHFVIFCFLSMSLFACTAFSQWIDEKYTQAHSALNLTKLLLFLTCLALSTLPSVQQVLFRLTFYQIVGIIIVGTALLACFQPHAYVAAQSRIALTALAGVGALLQYTYGGGQELATLSFLGISQDVYGSMNTIFVGTLVCAAMCALLLSAKKRIWLDWLILFVVALCFATFQWAYGAQEILQIAPSATYYLSSVTTVYDINSAIALIIAAGLPFSIPFLHRFPHINCLPLLVLSFTSTGMINFLYGGMGMATSAPLMVDSIGDLLTSNWSVSYLLIAASLLILLRLLLPRFPGKFTFWDYAVLFLSAFACAQMQTFLWERSALHENVLELRGMLFGIGQLVAYSLSGLVFSGLAIALVVLLLPLVCQLEPLEKMFGWFNRHASWLVRIPFWHTRMMVIITTVGCVMLAGLYLPGGPIFFQQLSGGDAPALFVMIYFAFLTMIAFGRRRLSFTRGDRFLVLMNIIFCTAFYFVRANSLAAPSQVFQSWNENMYNSQLPDVLFVLFIVWGVFIMFWWSARCKFSGDHRLLQIVAGLACIGGLLQLFIPSLFFALLTHLSLIMGGIVTTVSVWSSKLRNKNT